jgi:hypothetical protein
MGHASVHEGGEIMNLTYTLNELMKEISEAAGPTDITITMEKQAFERLAAREFYKNHAVFIPEKTLEEIDSLLVNTSVGAVVIEKRKALPTKVVGWKEE